MTTTRQKIPPGRVRDAILNALLNAPKPLTISQISNEVDRQIGPTPASSIRSYLRLHTPEFFIREERGVYSARNGRPRPRQRFFAELESTEDDFGFHKSVLYHNDCLSWLESQPETSIHAVVTDPPYGLHEYTDGQQKKLRQGKGGVWRIPPSFDGHKRSPLPRFTTLERNQLEEIEDFFLVWAKTLLPALVPGANVVVACNPLISFIVSSAIAQAGFERRGEIVRLTTTMRGGDRPKGAHEEFSDVSVLPRSMWEPWLIFRKPLDGRVQDNLRNWGTGGFRRISADKPFGDVIQSAPTRSQERALAPHPSLKPQQFMRQLVRGVLPLGRGIVLDPFAGAGSTLAACNYVGYDSIGVERDAHYFNVAKDAIPKLTAYSGNGSS
ncbi:MAG: site-specific DNA-methyltransferase [Gammaproteobacteria bacterium]|nr:site-specific DNA-methyltransferase [Gammaproteobacteria bacterium]